MELLPFFSLVNINKNISAKQLSPLSMPHITESVVFAVLSGVIILKSFYAFFQVVCQTVFYSVHSVFTSSADIPKVVIFSFPQWYYYIMFWLYSHALYFSSIFSILLDQQSQFLFTKLSVLIVSYMFPSLSPLCSNRHYLLTEHSRSVLLLTIQKRVPGLGSGKGPGWHMYRTDGTLESCSYQDLISLLLALSTPFLLEDLELAHFGQNLTAVLFQL